MTETTTAAEAEILGVLDALADALRRKDLDALARCYADDVRVFDIGAQLDGCGALRSLWEQCFPYFPSPIGTERRDVRIEAGSDVAIVTFLSRVTGMESDHPSATSWFRTTVGLRRGPDGWRIVHDHVSLPVDCGAEKPTYITDLD